jgi:hypothetical protein
MRVWAWSVAGLLFILFGFHCYIVFIRQTPEYAWTFPRSKQFPYWSPLTLLPGTKGVGYIGTPHQEGWKVISALYRTGQMRGSLRVTTVPDILEWYLGRRLNEDLNSAYVVSPESATRLNQMAIDAAYEMVGRVLVQGRPTLRIYERKDRIRVQSITDYRFEDYEPLYDTAATLDERVHYDEIKENGKVLFRQAGLAERAMRATEAVLFTDRRQVAPFGWYYDGDLPYVVLDGKGLPEDLELYLGARSSKQQLPVVLWGLPGSSGRVAWEGWLEHKTTDCEQSWQGNTGLAICGPPESRHLHLLQNSVLGGHLELLGYELTPDPTRRETRIVLYWAAGTQPVEDYTVFTHIVDSANRMIGQHDGPPDGGRQPTSAWRTDKVIRDEHVIPLPETPAGEYWVEVGMYRPATGERLPSSGKGKQPDGRIRLPTPLLVDLPAVR